MKKSEFVRSLLMPGVLASVVLVSASCSSSTDEMLGAANDFISILSEEQRERTLFEFEDAERHRCFHERV